MVNAWSGTFSQPSSFGPQPPALESVVIALNAGSSVGGGSGTPTAGNWLIVLAGMSEQATSSGYTIGVGDDVRSFWRPAKVSAASALTRTSCWYTANTARAAGNVYVYPNGAFTSQAPVVLEVSGLGPWDVITGAAVNYAAAATSLTLSLGAPAAASAVFAAITGDSDSVTQTFAPASWTTLPTVTATNGTDHTCDCVLTSAYLPSTSGSVSVSGTTVSASDLSGVIVAFQINAPSPVPAGANPEWPGVLKCEAALGAGFQTPADTLTWTDISARLRDWNETTGVQFQLGDLQATDGSLDVDCFDGALTPTGSPWSFTVTGTPAGNAHFTVTTAQSASISVGNGFTDVSNPGTLFTVTALGAPSGGNVSVTFTPAAANVMSNPDVVSQAALTTGTPIRIRAALGTIGGVTFNRWYVIRRNMQEWVQELDEILRPRLPSTVTDSWSVMSASGPTPYRGEVYQDNPYAWWACDDQPLAGGVQPVSLRNSAQGNTNVLTIQAASGGVSPGDSYSTTGTDLTVTSVNIVSPVPPGVAVYAVGQQPGFMYGDPASSQASFSTGNPVTASPGSAAWQQTGLLGNTGADGWFLTCNDASFPALSGGVTVGLWWNATFFGTAQGFTDRAANTYDVAGQPFADITLLELATASAPVAVIKIAQSGGALELVTYNGATPTTHSIYSSSDMRNSAWNHVMLTTNGSSWTVYVNGGLTAQVSGTGAGMTSAWTWLIAGADLGTSGGSTLSAAVHMGDFALSHIQVFGSILPPWRIRAHYCAAVTAFGLVPAPQTLALSEVLNKLAGVSYVPDGSEFQGSYGSTGAAITSYSMSALAVSEAGSYTSGPSARAVISGIGQNVGGVFVGNAVWVSWTAVAPSVGVYTATGADSELNAATCCGSGDSFTSGYGSGASGHGVSQTAAGTNASPPSSASALGDTAGQRLERILGYAGAAVARCIDPESLAVQAATDIGGQQAGQNLENITQSVSGLLYVDTLGHLTFWQKSHLAAQYSSPAWTISPAASGASAIPYAKEIRWLADPQRLWNAVQVTPFSPDGASLAVLTPTNASGVNSSQKQYGPQPLQITSYLQSTSEMQSQVNWLFSNFGQLQVRTEQIVIDAAAYPAAWGMVLQASVGDVISVTNWQVGGGGATGTFRISSLRRHIEFSDERTEGRLEITAAFEPSSYWS